jgi:hypothetical protein
VQPGGYLDDSASLLELMDEGRARCEHNAIWLVANSQGEGERMTQRRGPLEDPPVRNDPHEAIQYQICDAVSDV